MTTITRYHVEPSGLLDGWWAIHDSETGVLAKIKSRAVYRTRLEADKIAERLNRDLTRRAICRKCRHRKLATEMMGGRCRACRGIE